MLIKNNKSMAYTITLLLFYQIGTTVNTEMELNEHKLGLKECDLAKLPKQLQETLTDGKHKLLASFFPENNLEQNFGGIHIIRIYTYEENESKRLLETFKYVDHSSNKLFYLWEIVKLSMKHDISYILKEVKVLEKYNKKEWEINKYHKTYKYTYETPFKNFTTYKKNDFFLVHNDFKKVYRRIFVDDKTLKLMIANCYHKEKTPDKNKSYLNSIISNFFSIFSSIYNVVEKYSDKKGQVVYEPPESSDSSEFLELPEIKKLFESSESSKLSENPAPLTIQSPNGPWNVTRVSTNLTRYTRTTKGINITFDSNPVNLKES